MASPYPQPAWYGPAPLVPSALPSAVSRAVRLMRAGAAFAVVYGVVFGLFRHALVPGMVSGVFVSLLWLWMAWKNEAGRNWARVLSSVFFGFQCPGLLFSVIDGNWSLALLAALIEWGIGLAALILLWRPESGQFSPQPGRQGSLPRLSRRTGMQHTLLAPRARGTGSRLRPSRCTSAPSPTASKSWATPIRPP